MPSGHKDFIPCMLSFWLCVPLTQHCVQNILESHNAVVELRMKCLKLEIIGIESTLIPGKRMLSLTEGET